jgi:hypothetical protein
MALIRFANGRTFNQKSKSTMLGTKINTNALNLFLLFMVSTLFLLLHASSSLGSQIAIGISYNTETMQNEVRTIDPTTGASSLLNSLVFDNGGWTGHISVDVGSNSFYTISGGNRLYKFDLTTGAILATVSPDFPNLQAVEIITPSLFVVIPGINDHGVMMLWRAEEMFPYDAETEIQICESPDSRMCIRPDSIKCLNNPSDSQVRQAILEASKKAVEKGKDVIVNIDMDLENYTWEFPLPPFFNRWNRSVTWAGRIANIVSEAFNEEIPKGRRMLYAHSAGGDAAYQSIYQMRGKKMYDDFNLLNGRTSAKKLAKALKDSGYGWWQVKVFTNEGDLPATPPLPLLKLWLGSISNYDVAKSYAGDAWVHLHSCDITGHSGLRDAINVPGTFEINLVRSSGPPNCTVVDTVENLMLKDWRKP